MSGTHLGVGVHRFSGVPDFRLVRGLPRQRGRVTYEFDGDLLVVQEVGAFKDDTKGAFTDLLAHTVVDTHYVRRRGSHGFGSKDWNSWRGNLAMASGT